MHHVSEARASSIVAKRVEATCLYVHADYLQAMHIAKNRKSIPCFHLIDHSRMKSSQGHLPCRCHTLQETGKIYVMQHMKGGA